MVFDNLVCIGTQRNKKSKLSSQQNFTRKNFPNGVRKLFSRHMRQKCVNRFCNIHAYVPKLFLHKCKMWMLQKWKQSKKICNFFGLSRSFHTVRKLSRLSGNFPDCAELSTLSGNFPHCPATFQTVQKLSKLSKKFPACLETFQSVWKLSGPSGNFPVCPETFQSVWKLPQCLETFRVVLKLSTLSRKLSSLSGNFPRLFTL